jgi:hypothetical protein
LNNPATIKNLPFFSQPPETLTNPYSKKSPRRFRFDAFYIY